MGKKNSNSMGKQNHYVILINYLLKTLTASKTTGIQVYQFQQELEVF